MIRPCTDADFGAICEIINDAARAYCGVIPADCWHDPYMSREAAKREIASGVRFWGWEEGSELVGVMGIQNVRDVALIRHAYVRTANRNTGIGGKLLGELRNLTTRPILIGTWAAATWAIRFYERHGFRMVTPEEKNRLLREYWSISERQIETSVVLAEERAGVTPSPYPSEFSPIRMDERRGGDIVISEEQIMPVGANVSSRKWRVTVLRGGPSAEREVSLASGRAVAAAIRSLGHTVTEADIAADNLAALDVPADIVFPVLHGRFGEDGQLQAIMEQRGLCFVGSGAEASRVSIAKDAAKTKWREAGLPTAPWTVVTRDSLTATASHVVAPPCVIKPIAEGSSIGVTVCDSVEMFEVVLAKAVADFGRVMVEQRLRGAELTVGVLGAEPLPIIHVRPTTEFYDYDAKYQRDDTAYLLNPDIDSAVYREVQEMAIKAFQVLGCRDCARVDFIVDEHAGPQLLEINTMPGFTDHSLLPKAAAHAGIAFGRLVEMLLEMAWARR